MKLLRPCLLLTAAVCASVIAGCRTAEVPRGDLDTACRAAVERRLTPRTMELLENLADRHVGRERQLARIEAAANEDFRRFGAADDPRFVWAHEVECYAQLLLPDPSGRSPAARLEPVARRLLEFEQQLEWARLAACRDSAAEREAPLLALRIATGWSEKRILGFDFSSLPEPRKSAVPGAPADPVGPGVQAARRAAELLTLCGDDTAQPEALRAALQSSAEARRKLAECYLNRALRRWRQEKTPAALAEWRIARARYDLEKSFPAL